MLILILFLACSFFVACFSKPLVSGEIFIVTRGAGNYKMGGVPIVAINENEFNDVFAKKGSEIKLLSDKIGQKETECAGKTRTSYLARLEYDICLSDAAKFRTEMNGLYTAALPRPMATTTTDSDGKFKLALPSSGKYIIFSTASRAAGSTTEAYLWIVPIDATGGEQSLSLSSNNLWEPN